MSLMDKLKKRFSRDSVSDVASPKPKKGKENYVENKNDALNLICGHLSRYAYSTDKNLSVLELWIIAPENDSQVAWADSIFLKELKSRLHQERIEAIKTIEVSTLTLAAFDEIRWQDASIQPMVEGRLYYKTHTASQPTGPACEKTPVAWLCCVGGREHIRKKTICLNPREKKSWHIGRSEQPSVIDRNDIVIEDSCKDISRQHAIIVVDAGRYYLKCKEGGCRARGGRVTKIIRAAGSQDELVLLSHRALPPLDEGDVIQLSKSVYLRFSLIEPETGGISSALQEVDDSF